MTLPGWGAAAPQPRPVLKPLVYCAFRSQEAAECAVFAHEKIEKMAFCQRHAQMLHDALAKERELFGGKNGD